MGVFDFFNKKNKQNHTIQYRYQYTAQQDAIVEQFIEQNFGPIDTRIHDICGNSIKVDLLFISPNDHNPSYLLVTKGLGAYIMAQSEVNLSEDKLSRVEFVLESEEPWEIGFGDNRDLWAQELCAAIADHIINLGLSIKIGQLHQSDLNLDLPDCADIISICNVDNYESYQDFTVSVALNDFEKVNFLLLVNYDEDEACPEDSHDTDHPNKSFDDVGDLVDIAEQLGIDPINAYNRVCFFLRWAIKHQLINGAYLNDLNGDMRHYLQNNLASLDKSQLFNAQGLRFVNNYYDVDECTGANYIDDLKCLELSLNQELHDTIDGLDPSLLYLEFTDEVYSHVEKILDDVYDAFDNHVEYDNVEDHELFEVAKNFLGTDCLYFAPTNNDYNLASAFCYSHEYYAYEQDSNDECPVIMVLDYNYIKGLINYQCPNSAQEHSFYYDPQERENSIRQALQEAQSYQDKVPAILARLMESNIKDLQNAGGTFEDLQGDFESAHQERLDCEDHMCLDNYNFESYWAGDSAFNSKTNEEEDITKATLLTYLPVARPYQVLAYLPFVPRCCGMTLSEMMAVAAYFEDRYEAYVAVVSADTIEFTVDCQLTQEEAFSAAQDLYAFTPYALDMCEVPDATLAHLASFLMENQVWTCCFDLNEDTYINGEQEQEDSAFSF